jgi:hypothetical protein
MRDAKICQIYEGTHDIQRVVLPANSLVRDNGFAKRSIWEDETSSGRD